MAEKTFTKEEMLADLDIQLRQVQLEAARASLQDTQENLAEREMKRKKRQQDQRNQGKQLADEDAMRRARVLACMHKKGGMDFAGWKKGNNDMRSLIRFQLPNTDYMNQCTRCGNRVIPPVEPLRVADFSDLPDLTIYGLLKPAHAGYFLKSDKEGYAAALRAYRAGVKEYNEWLELPTNNIPSTACLPTQTGGAMDWKRLYRLATHEALGIPIFAAQKYHADEEAAA
jgi:hypothetical protein